MDVGVKMISVTCIIAYYYCGLNVIAGVTLGGKRSSRSHGGTESENNRIIFHVGTTRLVGTVRHRTRVSEGFLSVAKTQTTISLDSELLVDVLDVHIATCVRRNTFSTTYQY